MELTARNTNDLAPKFYAKMQGHGVRVETRNGPALKLPGVTTITIRHPWERVNFGVNRDCNPFFHLIEAAAMLAGDAGNNVNLLSYFASGMAAFSDNGDEYNAFYGTRARNYGYSNWGYMDQLIEVCQILDKDPDSRQAMVQLWDPIRDLGRTTKDKACNLCMIFTVESSPEHGKKLCMTSFNRSNDCIFGGVTGANVVHLSFFQEYVACALDMQMGEWHHSSANAHIYLSNTKWPGVAQDETDKVLYPMRSRGQKMLFTGHADVFDGKLLGFISDLVDNIQRVPGSPITWECNQKPDPEYQYYISEVLMPMATAYIQWKEGDKRSAYDSLWGVQEFDWQLAGLIWFKRRQGITLSPNLLEGYPRELFTA